MNSFLAFHWPLSQAAVEFLGWILVHSLWQFALVALLAGITVRALQQYSSALRYLVLVSALSGSMILPLATGVLQFPAALADLPSATMSAVASQSPAASPGPSFGVQVPVGGIPIGPSTAHLTPPTPRSLNISTPIVEKPQTIHAWFAAAQLMLKPWLAWLVTLWSLGVVLCSIRPLLGCHTLWQLQRVGVSPVSDEVLAAVSRVSQRLGLRHAVRVLQTTWARVPVVVGYLRPVILLPVSLMTSLSPSQLEAILAHELAHVRRHDFIVNLLQILLETLFFYHPAVWWLSRQIRIEREHCCDDLVVKSLGNRVEYGRALLAVEELRGHSTLLAPGATDGSLVSRLRRILNVLPEHAGTASLSSRWAVACVLPCTLLLLACGTLISLRAQDGAKTSDISGSFIVEGLDTVAGKRIEGTEIETRKETVPLKDGERKTIEVQLKSIQAAPQKESAAVPSPEKPDAVAIRAAHQQVDTVVSRFVQELRRQNVPFLSDDKYQALQSELRQDLGRDMAGPLSPARLDALNAALDAFVQREFNPVERDYLYLEFRDRFETLKWALRIALSSPELNSEQTKVRDAQRAWMRAEIERLPESIKFNRTHKVELAKLETLFNDPMNPFFQIPLSDAGWRKFQVAFQDRVGTTPLEMQLSFAAPRLFQSLVGVFADELFLRWPVQNQGRQMRDLRWSLVVTPQIGNTTLMIMDVKTETRDICVDVIKNIFAGENAPASFVDRESWLQKQGQGDLACDGQTGELIGVRGAKLAVLEANDWYSADKKSLADLQTLIRTTGQNRIPLASFIEVVPIVGDPTANFKRLKSSAPAFVIQTHEGRISVVRIVYVAGNNVVIRSRPRLSDSPRDLR